MEHKDYNRDRAPKQKPGISHITRCYKCGKKLIAVDTYETSKKDGREWITRWFDIDWVLEHHVRREHSDFKDKPKSYNKPIPPRPTNRKPKKVYK